MNKEQRYNYIKSQKLITNTILQKQIQKQLLPNLYNAYRQIWNVETNHI